MYKYPKTIIPNLNIKKENKNLAKFQGKLFWSGIVSTIDYEIEEVHTWEEGKASDFHHSFYVSNNAQARMRKGESVFFWITDTKEIEFSSDDDSIKFVDIERSIRRVIKI